MGFSISASTAMIFIQSLSSHLSLRHAACTDRRFFPDPPLFVSYPSDEKVPQTWLDARKKMSVDTSVAPTIDAADYDEL